MAGLLAPSVLNADLARLADQVAAVRDQSDWIHLDIMDGHFVPNLTFGPPVVAALRPHTDLFFDCHLMVERPEELLEDLAAAGAGMVSMHVEALRDPAAALATTRSLGMRAGLALRPDTPLEPVLAHLADLDLVLPMTVEPGFGGQAFRADVLPKIEAVRSAIEAAGVRCLIEVDGGVHQGTLPACRDAGAEVFVVGTAIFRAPDPGAAAKQFRAMLQEPADG